MVSIGGMDIWVKRSRHNIYWRHPRLEFARPLATIEFAFREKKSTNWNFFFGNQKNAALKSYPSKIPRTHHCGEIAQLWCRGCSWFRSGTYLKKIEFEGFWNINNIFLFRNVEKEMMTSSDARLGAQWYQLYSNTPKLLNLWYHQKIKKFNISLFWRIELFQIRCDEEKPGGRWKEWWRHICGG